MLQSHLIQSDLVSHIFLYTLSAKMLCALYFLNFPQFFVNQDSLAGISYVVRLPLTSCIKDQSMVQQMQLYTCREAALWFWIFLISWPLATCCGSTVYNKSPQLLKMFCYSITINLTCFMTSQNNFWQFFRCKHYLFKGVKNRPP